MIKLQTFQEEFDTNPKEIKLAEHLWGAPFPEEYKTFLLKNNGGIVYPNFPRIKTDTNGELWRIERLMSVGDLMLQKKYAMEYTYKRDHDEEDLAKYNLNGELLLTFAVGQRGCYYIDLQPKYLGQLYFCSYQDGDGIIRIETKSFSAFMDSLFMQEDDEEDYDPDFKLTGSYYQGHKIFKKHLFQTEEDPELGFERFKEVFARFVDLKYPEKAYQYVLDTQVYDFLKLDFLLRKGYMSDGLLNRANDPQIIKYLIEEKGLDINEPYNGRYPLEHYLKMTLQNSIGNHYYLLIDKLLGLGIEMDWSVLDDTDDPLIQQLERAHQQYLENEVKDKNWWKKEGRASGHTPFKKGKHIEAKLGIENNDNWFSRLFKK